MPIAGKEAKEPDVPRDRNGTILRGAALPAWYRRPVTQRVPVAAGHTVLDRREVERADRGPPALDLLHVRLLRTK